MTAYVVTLYLHSYLRWGVLALLLLVTARAWTGFIAARAWTRFDEIAHIALLKTAYVQFLFGLILYVFSSPYSAAFLANIGAGIQQSALRFFGMLHIGAMFAAVGILQQGRRLSLLAKSDRSRYLRVAVTTSCALIVVCAAIPWPIFEYGRPLLRLPSACQMTAGS
ncbi:MAG TPA: hypothetical protein VJR89_33280 [Polyangiales bacterium]|nr:hypothetical protein [Polyangiales bacterium]